MGIEPFLIGATMRGVVAQRLARRTCQDCSKTQNPSCETCGGTQTSGRTVIYEILEVTQGIGKLINQGADELELASLAITEGMKPMIACGARLVESGRVTHKEVVRVSSVGGEHG
jgi:general secretion pathway protein E